MTLPNNAPLTPSYSDCALQDEETPLHTPNSLGQLSVLRCPSVIGGSCPQRLNKTPGRRFFAADCPSSGLDSTPGRDLTWDGYAESPLFASQLSPNNSLRRVPKFIKPSVASSTDPNIIDGSSKQEISGIEQLYSGLTRKVQLVSTDCSDFDEGVIMDTSRARKLNEDYQAIIDEISDMDPDTFTAEFAPQMRQEVDKLWDMKNKFRNGVRDAVKDLSHDDVSKQQWEACSTELVNKVISHRNKVLASIERLCPTESMSEFQ